MSNAPLGYDTTPTRRPTVADTVPEDVPPPDDVIKTAKDALALFSGDLSDYGITCILLDRARSLSPTPPSREWRTIDSAPRDGTRVLVYAPGHLLMLASFEAWKTIHAAGPWWWSNGSIITPEPTHWMPLPSPPVEGVV